MFNVRELKAEMARAEINQKELAKHLGVSEQTLIRKMRRGSFSVAEAQKACEVLHCDPGPIFFASDVAY